MLKLGRSLMHGLMALSLDPGILPAEHHPAWIVYLLNSQPLTWCGGLQQPPGVFNAGMLVVGMGMYGGNRTGIIHGVDSLCLWCFWYNCVFLFTWPYTYTLKLLGAWLIDIYVESINYQFHYCHWWIMNVNERSLWNEYWRNGYIHRFIKMKVHS